jgi:hypothetical protein
MDIIQANDVFMIDQGATTAYTYRFRTFTWLQWTDATEPTPCSGLSHPHRLSINTRHVGQGLPQLASWLHGDVRYILLVSRRAINAHLHVPPSSCPRNRAVLLRGTKSGLLDIIEEMTYTMGLKFLVDVTTSKASTVWTMCMSTNYVNAYKTIHT